MACKSRLPGIKRALDQKNILNPGKIFGCRHRRKPKALKAWLCIEANALCCVANMARKASTSRAHVAQTLQAMAANEKAHPVKISPLVTKANPLLGLPLNSKKLINCLAVGETPALV